MTRAQANTQRVLWVLALALFAVSASHLGRFHAGDDGWAVELVGHHAAIPLAFAILYQDYRFALADLFLKRALTLIAIVAIAFAGYTVVTTLPSGPFAAGVLLALWVATSLVSPWLHRRIVRFVDQSLLGRVDYAALRVEHRPDAAGAELDRRRARYWPARGSHRRSRRSDVWWIEDQRGESRDGRVVTSESVVPTTDEPRYVRAHRAS